MSVIGTAAYTIPEQARGQPADKRTDIWAFGCVLYEMLTGVAAFGGGETVSDIIGRILEREPDWTRLPQSTPIDVRALLRRCLDKDFKRRLRDIGDARAEFEEREGHDVVDGQRPTGRILVAAALGIGILLGVVGAGSILRTRAEAPLRHADDVHVHGSGRSGADRRRTGRVTRRRIALAAVNGGWPSCPVNPARSRYTSRRWRRWLSIEFRLPAVPVRAGGGQPGAVLRRWHGPLGVGFRGRWRCIRHDSAGCAVQRLWDEYDRERTLRD